MNSNKIREEFFKFFESKNHKVVPSAPMVVKDDPTLMFTNAGMNQFKDLFLGNSVVKYSRVADSQKCLRVSGKHNDLEEVGHDTYHHTMFEMLGNWSFGDYFKKDAIHWAYEFLIDKMGLDKNRMYVTVFEGSVEDNVDFDQEAFDLWKALLPESQIINGNKKDNFWEMGEVGPCGPCSEVHYDLRDDKDRTEVDGADLVNKDNPLVIEIWNLVFMQYNRKMGGILELLPNQHVDTGMGFERLCMILQGKKSNYDTDVFQLLIQKLSSLCSIPYGQDEKADIAMRVISDHLRAITFSIADGQIPSNVKAGYVIRRILRRAVRYGYTYLNFRSAFICKLVPTLVRQLGTQFPEIAAQQGFIEKIVEEEESTFLRTLATGINMLDSLLETIKKDGKTLLSGNSAFILYDTYGFPLDLTELICRENEITVDIEEFNIELQKQKARSRNAATVETHDWVDVTPCAETKFVGYDETSVETQIARYRTVVTKNTKHYQIVLTETPFYGTSGGQLGDIGKIFNANDVIEVTSTVKENGLIIHVVSKLPDNVEGMFTAEIDVESRRASAANHTATHLLHKALRTVLGSHVEQKGSMVSPNVLRFDFSHYQKMTEDEINDVIRLVNAEIRENHFCEEERDCPIENAKGKGAMMLFGEKYTENVRTIKFGESFELCGGIHAERTGDIGGFAIMTEGAISSGIRRIEALTGSAKVESEITTKRILTEIQTLFNTKSVLGAIEKLVKNNSDLNKNLDVLLKERADVIKQNIKKRLIEENGVMWYISELKASVDMIKEVATQLYSEMPNIAFIATTSLDNKPGVVVMFGKKCIEDGANAGTIIKSVSKLIQGGGGGQPHIASAGGKDTSKLAEVLDVAKAMAVDMLSK